MLDDDIPVGVGTGAGDLCMEQMLHVDAVFLTHSHRDHTVLLPMLADSAGPRRDKPLAIYALPETIAVIKRDLFNFRLWPDYTAYTALPSPAHPYIVFKAVTVGKTMELSGRRITPLPVRHAVPGVAYKFESLVASLVFSGDTTQHAPSGMPWPTFIIFATSRSKRHSSTAILPGLRLPGICVQKTSSTWIKAPG